MASQAGFEPATRCLEGILALALCYRACTTDDFVSSYRVLNTTPLYLTPKSLFSTWELFEPLLQYTEVNITLQPAPCCDEDPLFHEALFLARRYGIEEAAGEPGFESVVEDVAGYLLKPTWPPRKSFRNRQVIHETIIVDSSTGQQQIERHVRTEMGLESRAGAGGMLPIYYNWWKQKQSGRDLFDIGEANTQEFGPAGDYDDRSVNVGIEELERLLKPL